MMVFYFRGSEEVKVRGLQLTVMEGITIGKVGWLPPSSPPPPAFLALIAGVVLVKGMVA